MRRILTTAAAFAMALGAHAAFAQRPLDSVWTGKESVSTDGDFDEWMKDDGSRVVAFAELGRKQIVAGVGPYTGPDDLRVELGLAHNAKMLFAAFDVTDQAFVRRTPRVTLDDHMELWFAAPKRGGDGYDLVGFGVFADPTGSEGKVEVVSLSASPEGVGGPVRGARGGMRGGETSYRIEVAIPWAAFPGGAAGRRDLRVLAFAVDSDSSDLKVHETIMGTGGRDLLGTPEAMPMLVQSDVGAGLREFNDSVGLPRDLLASYSVEANECGDARKEEVAVVDRYITVIGCTASGGGFFYRETPVAGSFGVLGIDAANVTGGARPAIVLRYQDNAGGAEREWTEIYVVTEDGLFTTVFSALTAYRAEGYTVENAIKLGSRSIVVTAKKLEGALPSEPPAFEGNAMAMDKKPLKYRYDGARFVAQ
jgi:hypothetical protein